MFTDADQVREYVAKALFDGDKFQEPNIYQIIFEMVQKLALFENPSTIEEVQRIVSTGKSVVYMHAGWWPSSDEDSFKAWAATDQSKWNNSLKCVLIQWDDLARNMPREWQTGYVPNCVIFEDGELVKKFAGNGYVEQVSSNLAFTPQEEVKGFADDHLNDQEIAERMKNLFRQESVSSIAQSPLYEEIKKSWEAEEGEDDGAGIVLTPDADPDAVVLVV